MLQETAPPPLKKDEEQCHKAVRNMDGDSVRSFSTAGDRNSTAKSLNIDGVYQHIKLAQFGSEAQMI